MALNRPAVAKRSLHIFIAHPVAMIAIALPAATFNATSRLWWSPSLDLLASVTSIAVSEWVAAALVYAAGSAYRGERPSFVESYRQVFRRLGALLELLVRYWGAVTLLTLTIIGIPYAVRTFIRWFFSTEALILFNATPKEAISLSCQSVNGSWWQIAATGLLIGATLALPSIAIWILWEGSSAGYVIIAGTISAVIGPLMAIFWTLLFLQLHSHCDKGNGTARVPARMTCPYHSDLAASQEAIRLARDELLGVIDPLSRADMERARKGGWTVQKVLDHVIRSERLYGQAVAYLVGAEAAGQAADRAPGSVTEARTMLLDGRKALLKALEALDEDPMAYETFYALKQMGHEEYSVLSVLENVANHDGEHAGQIREILAADR